MRAAVYARVRDRVQRFADGGELIAPDPRPAPIVGCHTAWSAPGAGAPAPRPENARAGGAASDCGAGGRSSHCDISAGPRARGVERDQHFPGKAIVADAGDGPFDALFVAGMSHARGVDVKVARLRVLEKRGSDAWCERVGLDDDGRGVSGMMMLNTPPKNSHAASHSSMARAVVSSKVG